MKDVTREPTTRGGSAEALVLACVLGFTVFALHTAWTACGLYWPRGGTNTSHPAAHWCFLVCVTVAAVMELLRMRDSVTGETPGADWGYHVGEG